MEAVDMKQWDGSSGMGGWKQWDVWMEAVGWKQWDGSSGMEAVGCKHVGWKQWDGSSGMEAAVSFLVSILQVRACEECQFVEVLVMAAALQQGESKYLL